MIRRLIGRALSIDAVFFLEPIPARFYWNTCRSPVSGMSILNYGPSSPAKRLDSLRQLRSDLELRSDIVPFRLPDILSCLISRSVCALPYRTYFSTCRHLVFSIASIVKVSAFWTRPTPTASISSAGSFRATASSRPLQRETFIDAKCSAYYALHMNHTSYNAS